MIPEGGCKIVRVTVYGKTQKEVMNISQLENAPDILLSSIWHRIIRHLFKNSWQISMLVLQKR